MINGDGCIISVIMGVYKQYNIKQLKQAVDSILNQTIRQIELIIYEDGYDKNIHDALEAMKAADERIILIGDKKNRGLAYALNCCLKIAKGKYIARMDADDISKPQRLEVQMDFLKQHAEYAFVGCNAELIDDNGVWGVRKLPMKPEEKDFRPYSPYIHPTVMFRSSVIKECGGYCTEKSVTRCEDYELFMRLHILGISGYNIQEELFCYREDKNGYDKRKYRYRINECRLRFSCFRKMGILNAEGIIYAIKPLIVGLIPSFFMEKLKHRSDGLELAKRYGTETGKL